VTIYGFVTFNETAQNLLLLTDQQHLLF